MRARRREERADHQLRLCRGRRRRGRHAGGAGGGDASAPASAPAVRTARATSTRSARSPPRSARPWKRRRTTSRVLVSERRDRRDRAIRRHRLRAVQSRQGGGDRLFLRDLHRKRGRSEHGRLPRLHGRGPATRTPSCCSARRCATAPASSRRWRRRAGSASRSSRSRSAVPMPARRASASHTASLSGSYTAYHAVFERYGVIEAEDADEAVAIAGVLVTCPLPKGRRVGIITPSGGGGVWMADTLSAHGLIVPPLSAATQAALRPLMPSYGASGNPVDVTAQGSNTGAGDDDGDGASGGERRDRHAGADHVADQRDARVARCRARARGGGAVRQADDGVDLYAASPRSGARRPRDAGCSCTATCAMSASRWASWRAMPRRWRARSLPRLSCRCHAAPARMACRVSAGISPPSRRWRRSCRRRREALATHGGRSRGSSRALGVSGGAENPVARSAAQDRGRRRAARPGGRGRRCVRLRRDDARRAGATSRTRASTAWLVQKMAPKRP